MVHELLDFRILASYAQSEGVRSKNSALPGAARCALASHRCQGALIAVVFSTWCEALSFVQALRQSKGSETKIYGKGTYGQFLF